MEVPIDDPILIKLLKEEDPETARKLREWTRKWLLSQTRLLGNFGHVNVYNKANYDSGLLDKLEELRSNIPAKGISEIIDILYTVGYGFKALTYLLYRYGYDGATSRQIRTYIQSHRVELDRKREEFMNGLIAAKKDIYQVYELQVKEAEGATIKIYLEKIKKLQDELIETCPVQEPAKFKRLIGTLDALQDRINAAHGIDDLRKAYIVAETQIAINQSKEKSTKELPNANVRTIEAGADSSFVGA